MILDLISSVINLIKFNKISFIVSIYGKVLNIYDTKKLSLATLWANTVNEVTLLQLKVAEFDDLSIKHHLEDLLGVVLIINSHDVYVAWGVLVLESGMHWVTLGAHGSVGNLIALPFGHQVVVLGYEYLKNTVLMDGYNFNDSNFEALIVLSLLSELVEADNPWTKETTWRKIGGNYLLGQTVHQEDCVVSD